jgi:hypothetical protein
MRYLGSSFAHSKRDANVHNHSLAPPRLQILASPFTGSPLLKINAVDGLDCFAYNEDDDPVGWELTWP